MSWHAFESLVSSSKVIDELKRKRNRQIKPILSEDELSVLENELLSALYTKSKIIVQYFWNGQIFSKTGFIKFLDKNGHKIVFDDNAFIYFEQVIKADFI